MEHNYYFFARSDHPCSNWYAINGDQANTSEKWFMMQKAMLFGDMTTLDILKHCGNPKRAKQLGRQVKRFSDDVWKQARFDCMYVTLVRKYYECPEFNQIINENRNKTFVEAAPWDRIWGIGYSAEKALDNKNDWGENLLGKAINKLILRT